MKQKIRITKEFNFEAAHALDGYDGKCKDIHGHSYHLEVTILGYPEENKDVSSCGMVIDFSDLKKVVKSNILSFYDHHLILRKDSRFKGIEKTNKRVNYVDFQPTCENMLIDIVGILQAKLPSKVTLVYAMLRETANSFAEWRIEDNS